MYRIYLSKRSEITGYFGSYQACFPGSEFTFKPLVWVLRVLGIITSVASVTKGYYVTRNSSGAIVVPQWYPVIHSGRMKDTIKWAFTNGASVTKVIKGGLPIVLAKIIRQIVLSRPSLLFVQAFPFALFAAVVWIVYQNGGN